MKTKPFHFNTDPEWLETQLNNRKRVPEFAQHIVQWQRDSKAVRAAQPCHLDLAYGKSAAEKLDVFPAQIAQNTAPKNKRPAPVVVFIHGGYWRSLDKADHSFVAPAFTQSSSTQAGACVVATNYALCPTVTMEQLVRSQVQALIWVYRNIAQYGGDPQRISVVGHSAGGHLAAMMLACHWQTASKDLPANLVKNALSLSGLHDLEPLRHSPYIQGDLRLTPSQVNRCSPAYFPAPKGQLTALCGSNESEEFIRQNRLIQHAWGKRCVPICEEVPGANHFSVLEEMCRPGSRAFELASDLLKF